MALKRDAVLRGWREKVYAMLVQQESDTITAGKDARVTKAAVDAFKAAAEHEKSTREVLEAKLEIAGSQLALYKQELVRAKQVRYYNDNIYNHNNE